MSKQLSESNSDDYLLAQIRESFGRVVYTHKTHEKQADICFAKHRMQQGLLVFLTAIGSGTFLASIVGIIGKPWVESLTTSFVALLVAVISLFGQKFKFGEETASHRNAASHLWNVRESYISLIADLMSGAISPQSARKCRDELQLRAWEVYKEAPRTSAKAFNLASEGLKNKEEMTFSPEEIDKFLPERLRTREA